MRPTAVKIEATARVEMDGLTRGVFSRVGVMLAFVVSGTIGHCVFLIGVVHAN